MSVQTRVVPFRQTHGRFPGCRHKNVGTQWERFQ